MGHFPGDQCWRSLAKLAQIPVIRNGDSLFLFLKNPCFLLIFWAIDRHSSRVNLLIATMIFTFRMFTLKFDQENSWKRPTVKRCLQRCASAIHASPRLKTYSALMTTSTLSRLSSSAYAVFHAQGTTVATSKVFRSAPRIDARSHQCIGDLERNL